MPQIKEGFKSQRLLAISSEVLSNNAGNPVTENLHITKIGYFPAVKYHYNRKDNGVDYYILIYCTAGEGWYKVGENTFTITENQYVILPPHTAYSFGASKANPWTIYWIHFKGKLAPAFFQVPLTPRPVTPGDNSRINERISFFEEIYKNLEFSYHSDYYMYASLCLYHFLASFKYIDQFSQSKTQEADNHRFSEKVIYYLRENVEKNLTLEHIASHFGYSPSHFSALFKQETKQSPIKYFITLKIEKACQYIELSNMKISEIYPKLGFQDAAYFTRIFGKIMGISPSKYREREQSN